ncbi:site-specific integrase [Limibaculum sp. M0105]|uniref:Site-specific integrase n=1 Tax=Thermohalobaculum xanthum TaxID=2753746 RepID=A0A8J7SCW3_9RHOB|nr:site-specific integrase [Thermohalobaculum xanthum]MBK0398491.1 site-specific integrase [Thermohalobaculum xanthum]
MVKVIPENEHIKHRYLYHLKQAKGRDEKTLDKVAAALSQFEAAIGWKDFKRFRREWGERFKTHLKKARSKRTGRPLSQSTVDATLAQVKAFVLWLADQPGYKSRVGYSDADYFNNSLKASRAAHARRATPYPSMEQCLHAFHGMPEVDVFERRDKALFAFFMLTGARVGAVASLRLKHVNLFDGHVFQDAREVATKNAKTFDTWFLPVDPSYREYFERWVIYLREVELFSDTDPLFPKPRMALRSGKFAKDGLAREHYEGTGKLTSVIRAAFARVHLPQFTPHSFRKTLVLYGDRICQTREQFKAYSMNMGHENLATTMESYLPVSRERQAELLKSLSKA